MDSFLKTFQQMALSSGLFSCASSKITSLAFESVRVEVRVLNGIAQTKVLQRFCNNSETPLQELEYVWPLAADSSVCDVAIEIPETKKVLKGVLFSKAEAKKKYDHALKEGQLVARVNENQDKILRLKIGNLDPKHSVLVTVDQVMHTEVTSFWQTHKQTEELEEEECWKPEQKQKYCIRIPTYVLPRYQSQGFPGSLDSFEPFDFKKDKVTEKEYISFYIEVTSDLPVENLESPSHSDVPIVIKEQILKEEKQFRYIYLVSGFDKLKLNKDFVLNWTVRSLPEQNVVLPRWSYERDHFTCLALFNPDKMICEIKERNKTDKDNMEYIFVLDRSGSMKDSNRIKHAKDAAILFLKSLPSKSYFNVLSFGTSCALLFPSSVLAEDVHINSAIAQIKEFDADMLGTELSRVFQILFPPEDKDKKPEKKEIMQRQVFILTDGEISMTETILKTFLTPCSTFTRIFALGIGDSVCHHALKEIAFYGGGECRFIQDAKVDNMMEAVIGLLAMSQQTDTFRADIQWSLDNKSKTKSISSTQMIPSIFCSQQYPLACCFPASRFQEKEEEIMASVKIILTSSKGTTEHSSFWPLDFKKLAKDMVKETGILGAVGHLLIQEERRKKVSTSEEMVQVSLATGVLCPETSFLLVDSQSKQNAETIRREMGAEKMDCEVIGKSTEKSTPVRGRGRGCSFQETRKRKTISKGLFVEKMDKNKEKQEKKVRFADNICKNIVLHLAQVQSHEGWFSFSELTKADQLFIEAQKEMTKPYENALQEFTALLFECSSLTQQRITDTMKILCFLWYTSEGCKRVGQWQLLSEKAEKWLVESCKVRITKPPGIIAKR